MKKTMSKELEAYKKLEWLADKLAYWSGHDIKELDEEYNYTNLFTTIYGAIEKLESFQRTLKARIAMNKSIIKEDIIDEMTLAQLEAETNLCNLLLALLEELENE